MIEELGSKLGEFLASLRFEGGAQVGQVDIVAHSMGGLIVRSYLSGKRAEPGVFLPPAETKVRKIIFIATPHAGTEITSLLLGGNDRQTDALQMGSAFIFDLATWNQGIDDLRGADAIAVLGDAGSGLVGTSRFNDPVTSLTSGSLGFVSPDRTRILPYCHTDGIALVGCIRPTTPIAQMNSGDHLTAQIMLSFLNDTQAWRAIGQSFEQHAQHSKRAGVMLRTKDASDRIVTPASVTAGSTALTIRTQSQVAYSDFLSVEQPTQLTINFGSSTASMNVPLTAGEMRPITYKPGPYIAGVFPSAAAVFPRTVAPGSLISIYGTQLAGSEVLFAGQPMPLSYADSTQVNTLIPENASGLVKLQVRNSTGEHTVNVLVEPVRPAIFAPALNAIAGTVVTSQSPLRPGDYVSLFLTGLGSTTERNGLQWANIQPEVTLGGQTCAVTFAGRAPGYPGLDQINCQISLNVQASDAAQVVVRSGSRVSNVTTLPVR